MAKKKAPNTRCEILDDDLAEVLGTDDCTMGEIRKFTKEYLEEEELVEEDENGRKFIYPDATLKSAFDLKGSKVSSKDFWFKYMNPAIKKKVEYYTP